MLDGKTLLLDAPTQGLMTKTADGTISDYTLDLNNSVTYMSNGTMIDRTMYPPYLTYTYYPNGTLTAEEENGSPVSPNNATSPKYTYDQLWNTRPIQNSEQAANVFINESSRTISVVRNESISPLKMFTSDYALYWFDYQSNYDTVLAQLGWNESITENIALARGAANCFGKDWVAMITWKYMQALYLANGDEVYQQMCQAFEEGAKYIAIFNYAPDMQGSFGILQDEHFQALQQFWTDEVNNPNVTRGQIKADTAFVLPKDYGSALRNQGDIVRGLWSPTQENQAILSQLQNALATHVQNLDIIYDDAIHPIRHYNQVLYWNQPG